MTPNGSDIQIENGGYARIHNAILEQLAQHDLSSREYACILHLLRMTYGFSRKECALSYADFAAATGIDRRAVMKVLQRLTMRNIFCKVEGAPNHPAFWSFNKYFEQWDAPTSGQKDHQLDSELVVKKTTTLVVKKTTRTGVKKTTSYISAKEKKEISKERDVSAKSKKAAKQPQEEKPAAEHPPDIMFERLCWILYGHQNFKTLTKDQRGKLNAECKVLRDDVGASADELATWFKSIWRNEWPGNKGDRPRIDQIRSGVAAYLARNNAPIDAAEAQPAPTVLPYIVTDSGEYQYVGEIK